MGTPKNNTSTTTSGPPPQVAQAYNNLLQSAQQIGSTPYQQYGGNLLAPFSGSQQTAFNTIDNSQGIAQPYINQAQQYAQMGASPITAQQILNYANPYQQQVTNATMANINETNAQQQNQVVGNAAAQGALGGDRVGIAQAELARQQGLANNQTLAGLNQQGFNTSLSAAQQDAARQGQAAFTFGNLGAETQNTRLQGAQAQLGAGALQQNQVQQGLNIPYQQFLQQQAFPYQQLGWEAGIDTGVGSQLGGTSTTTSPGPNPWSQIAGLGISALGAAGSGGLFSGLGSMFSGPTLGGNSLDYLASQGVVQRHDGGSVRGYADGGITTTPYADAQTYIPQGISLTRGRGAPPPPGMPQQDPSSSSNANKMVSDAMGIAKMMKSGMSNSAPLQLGGPMGYGSPMGQMSPMGMEGPMGPLSPMGSSTMGPRSTGGFVPPDSNGIYVPRGYADGGDTFDQRFVPIEQAQASDASPLPVLSADNLGLGKPVNWDAYQEGAPARVTSGISTGPGTEKDDNSVIPDTATPVEDKGPQGIAAQRFGIQPQGDAGSSGIATDAPHSKLDNLWPALMSAGFGMMASRSPFLGTAIGEGGLQGLNTYSGLQQADRTMAEKAKDRAIQSQRVDLEAGRLAQTAKQESDRLALQTQQFEEAKKQHAELLNKPVAVQGALVNPKTGEVVYKGSGLSDAALEITARQVANGDLSGLTNIGRGTQGDQKLTAVRNKAAEILTEEGGMSPEDAAATMSKRFQAFKAQGIGLGAESRTAGTREANLNLILKATEAAVPAALEASEAVSRTGWVPINQIIQKGQVIASSPELKQFGMANLQLAEHWARAMNPTGVMRESDRDMALNFLNTADSKDTYKTAVLQLQKQITRERDAVRSTRDGAAPVPGASAGATASPVVATPAAPAASSAIPPAAQREVNKVYQTPKGPATWTGSGWVQ